MDSEFSKQLRSSIGFAGRYVLERPQQADPPWASIYILHTLLLIAALADAKHIAQQPLMRRSKVTASNRNHVAALQRVAGLALTAADPASVIVAPQNEGPAPTPGPAVEISFTWSHGA